MKGKEPSNVSSFRSITSLSTLHVSTLHCENLPKNSHPSGGWLAVCYSGYSPSKGTIAFPPGLENSALPPVTRILNGKSPTVDHQLLTTPPGVRPSSFIREPDVTARLPGVTSESSTITTRSSLVVLAGMDISSCAKGLPTGKNSFGAASNSTVCCRSFSVTG